MKLYNVVQKQFQCSGFTTTAIYVCLLVRKRSPKPLKKVRCFPGVLVFIST
nr:MAG TPA: hypothetical protein [Caudoviricetes sp.]